jgi:hypothetical protein
VFAWSTGYCFSITLIWNANTEADLAGYKLYYGIESLNYSTFVDVGNVTEYTIDNLEERVRYYFALTAYDLSFNESGFSVQYSFRHPGGTISMPWIKLLLLEK